MQPLSGHIADIRKDYRQAALDESGVGGDPLAFFAKWFSEAEAAGAGEVNAMTLATADAHGLPHARIVLLKGLDDRGFTFFTNYESAKGNQIGAQQHVALVFFWKELERQVRVEGIVEKVSAAESDAYFQSRPEGSRIGAWASPQSRRIENREVLERAESAVRSAHVNGIIPRPVNWGGYRVIPRLVEFWQGRSSRLHDRIVFEQVGSGWEQYRLAP